MGDTSRNSAVPLDPSSTLEPPPGSSHQPSQGPPPPPTLAQDPPHRFDGWRAIGEQQEFYDDEGFLCLSHNLKSEKLNDRKEDDVVIFDYLLSQEDGDPPVEGSCPSSGGPGEDDQFFQVHKDRLIESEQLSQVTNLRSIQSRGRLAIM